MVTALSYLDRILSGFLMLLMALMVVDVSWQVVTRFVLSQPSSYTEEIARFMLIWIGLLGSAYAYRMRAHLGLDLLVNHLTPSARRKAAMLVSTLSFVFAALVMVYGGTQLVLLTLDLEQTSPALQVPMGYVYAVIPISGVVICLYALSEIAQGGVPRKAESRIPVE